MSGMQWCMRLGSLVHEAVFIFGAGNPLCSVPGELWAELYYEH